MHLKFVVYFSVWPFPTNVFDCLKKYFSLNVSTCTVCFFNVLQSPLFSIALQCKQHHQLEGLCLLYHSFFRLQCNIEQFTCWSKQTHPATKNTVAWVETCCLVVTLVRCQSAEYGGTWWDLMYAKAFYWHEPCAVRSLKLPIWIRLRDEPKEHLWGRLSCALIHAGCCTSV